MKNFKAGILYVVASLLLVINSQNALAVEEEGIHIVDRWSVVGTINTGEDSGVVVMMNTVSQKTFTLKIGARLPSDPQFMIKKASGNKVTISDSNVEHTLAHITGSGSYGDERAPREASESRFSEAYYDNSKNDRGMSIYQYQDKKHIGVEPDQVPMPSNQFGNMTDEEIRARIEKYRGKKEFFANADSEVDADADTDYVISYDNFADGTEVEILQTGDTTWIEAVETGEEASDDLAEISDDGDDEVADENENEDVGDDAEYVE